MNLKSITTRIIQKLKKWFKRKGYNNLAAESQALVHLAVHLVEAVKSITIDTVLDDVIAALLCKLLPNLATTIRRFKLQLEQNIPQWLLQRHEAYSELATRCLYHLSGGANGKFDWQDCSDLVEDYYTNFVKEKIT